MIKGGVKVGVPVRFLPCLRYDVIFNHRVTLEDGFCNHQGGGGVGEEEG